ncbi:hypothetical protein Golob_013197 [Gossypium lobatum]|uniref:DUF4283 domain-containing protein n=1 Tax=Gossypium lobatum TaxID=34289 RepID=A0A7J8LNR4_9ROSI|nr:hypothetical protein [Gossypium lobatum]
MSSSQPLDWRKLFDLPSDQSLVFFPPEVHGGSITVKPPAVVFDEGIRCWHHLLVAQFLGQPPNFHSLQKLVLDHCPWHIQNKPMVLRKWEPNLQRLDSPLTICRIGYIASALGTPFYMDKITTLQQRHAYVKVCFEISVDFEFPGLINVELHDGSFVLLELKYYGC